MNKNIDLTKILKGCPNGTKFYSSIYGELIYSHTYISPSTIKFVFILPNSNSMFDNTPIKIEYYWNGKYIFNMGECTLFPSKKQRDWSKFSAPWYKKKKFDPNTLVPFTKVLIRKDLIWMPTMFTFLDFSLEYPRMRYNTIAVKVIPYNNDTKHLIGKTDEAPEYYRYWEK